MFSIVDDLRAHSAPADDCRRAEQISLQIHKLELALLRADHDGAKAARDNLKALAAAWLQRRVFGQTDDGDCEVICAKPFGAADAPYGFSNRV